MEFSRTQLIVIAAVFFVILFFIGIFTGIIPGLKKTVKRPPSITLTIWGIDDRDLFRDNLNDYRSTNLNIQVNYEQKNPATYERDLINALAAGRGPDIMMFHNTWLPKHGDKIVPLNQEQLSLTALKGLFPTVIEDDFVAEDKIYALPLYIDTLALFYNRDIFDKYGIALEPKDWLDFQNLIPKLRIKDESGNLTRPAVAIGGSNNSIDKASDLLMLMMLQAGTRMTDKDFFKATFGESVEGKFPGRDALEFYTKFNNPENELYYTWNDEQEYSLDSFTKGNVAMIFNYASQRETVSAKNPFLNFRVAEMPQLAIGEKSVNYPEYWGLAVTNNSQYPEWAWNLVRFLTIDEVSAEAYLKISDRPPALRTLIQKYVDHPELGAFAKQALSAKSWKQINNQLVANIFSEMIRSVINKNLNIYDALSQGERQVTELMRPSQ